MAGFNNNIVNGSLTNSTIGDVENNVFNGNVDNSVLDGFNNNIVLGDIKNSIIGIDIHNNELNLKLNNFAEILISDRTTEDEVKKEALKTIEFVKKEMVLAKEQRNHSSIISALNKMGTILGISVNLINLWKIIRPIIESSLSK
jgi:hypothetical protein